MYSNIIKTFKTRIKYEHKLFFEKEKIFIILILDEKFLEITFPKKYLISETPIILFLWIIFSSIILSLISFLFMRIQVRAISRLAKFSEDFGSGMCNITRCCTDVCPEHIQITDNSIIPLKERVVDRYYDPI